jgi:uncharacterized protein (TIGR03118 family)
MPPARSAAGRQLTAGTLGLLLAAGGVAAGAAPDRGDQSAAAAPSYSIQRQVADTGDAGAGTVDPDLVNPWGLAQAPGGPLWVTNNGTSTSTVYGGGTAPSQQLDVTVAGGDPTGEIYNDTSAFEVGKRGARSPALFVFDSETGKLSGWAGGAATVVAARVRHAVFKGLALATAHGKPRLFATDFHHGRVVAFNGAWHRLKAKGFTDPRIPKHYAPFGIAALRGRLFVSYAKQDSDRGDDVAGAGHGFLDVYSATGKLEKRLVRRGALDSPWGLAIAPKGFGSYARDLLVGNFGDGQINVFDPATGKHLGMLRDAQGDVITLPGLWGLLPGNGMTAPRGSVAFSSGPGDEGHGLLGYLAVN